MPNTTAEIAIKIISLAAAEPPVTPPVPQWVETLIKIISLVVALIPIYQVFIKVTENNKSRSREELHLIKEFIERNTSQPEPHPFLIEKSYLAISGRGLRADEIMYLLNFPNPSQMLRDYTLAKGFVEYNDSDKRINYKPKYKARSQRRSIKLRNLIGYGFSGFFAGAPILFAQSFNFSEVAVLGVPLFAFGSLAWLFLRILGSVEAAERVMEAEAAQLKSKAKNDSSSKPSWWEQIAGTFADNSAYDEAMQLGREYRDSLRPNSTELSDE